MKNSKQYPAKRHARYTAEEDKTLRKLYGTMRGSAIAELMNRTVDGIHARAALLKLSIRTFSPWTAAEKDYVKKHHPFDSLEHIAKKLNKTHAAVQGMAVRLQITTRYPRWTMAEISYVRKWYGKKKTSDIARHLNRSHAAVVRAAVQQRVTRPIPKKRWSEEDAAFLREHLLTMTYKDIAAELGRTEWAIGRKAFNLELVKRERR